MYHAWAQMLPETVELWAAELPGRWGRLDDPLPESVPELVSALVEAARPLFDRRVMLLGYSLGGLIAFEFATAMRDVAGRDPTDVFMLARGAPPTAPVLPKELDPHATDEEFIAQMIDFYGPFPGNAHLDPELLALILPPLRTDIRLMTSYHPVASRLISSAIHVFAGRFDRATTEDGLNAWRARTTGSFQLTYFPCDHFFSEPEIRVVASRIVTALE
jgi:surfactin synthase thioesterase subunit